VTDTTAQSVGQSDIDTGRQNTDIEENILDAYENPTYHFRLYMMSKRAVQSREFSSNQERVVIAESGVSVIDIDDVEIKTLGSISKEAGVGVATNISFTLREPFGSSLLDQIQRAGYFLGIENFQKFPLFLELSFAAHKASYDGIANNAESDHPLRGLVWTWPIQLTNMAMNVTSGGSVYSMEAVAYSDHAYSNQASDLEQLRSISTKTVGDFFTQLQQELNRIEKEKADTSGYKSFDTYQFYIDDKVYNEPIVAATEEELQNRSATYSESDGTMTFSFQPGISIEKIIYNVLSLTKYFQNEIKGTEDPDDPGIDKGGNEEALYQKLWRVIADADVLDYDLTRSDYARSLKYLIIPYDMTTVLTPASISNKSTDQEKVNSYRSRGLIKKLYNYIYTGLNDQVFDFELNFNFNWFAALPIQGGVSTNYNRAEPKGKATPEQIQEVDKEGGKTAGFDIGGEFRPTVEQVFDPAETQAQANSLFGSVNDLFSDASNFTTNAVSDATSAVSDAQAGANIDVEDAIGTVQPGVPDSDFLANSAASLAIGLPGLPTTAAEFVANNYKNFPRLDLTPNSNITDKAQRGLRSLDIQLDQVTLEDDAADRIATTLREVKTADTDGQVYAASPGQTLLSAMFEQAQSPVSGDLINIELRVKGDPYWLEPSPVARNDAPTSFFRRIAANRKFNPDSDAQAVDTTEVVNQIEQEFTVSNSAEQQTLMVFRSFTPQEFDPETGLTPAGRKNVNVLNGIYAVREVTHSFSGGEFTQTLYGLRQVQINLRNTDLFEYLKDDPEATADAAQTPPASTDTGAATLVEALAEGTAVAYAGGVDLRKNPLGAVTGVNTSPTGQVTTPPTGPVDFQGRPITGDDDG
jgi:hypothetical protein